MPITIDLRENAMVKDLIAEVQAEAQKEAEEERQRINGMILSLYHELHLPVEQIARMADKDLAYIEDLILQEEEDKKQGL